MRPDVRPAEQTLVSTNARIGIAKADFFPSISLTGLFGFVSTELDNLLSNSTHVWNIGAAMSGPIYQGGRVSGEVAASEAVQRQAFTGYLKTVQLALREVDDALANLQTSREQLSAYGNRRAALTNMHGWKNCVTMKATHLISMCSMHNGNFSLQKCNISTESSEHESCEENKS